MKKNLLKILAIAAVMLTLMCIHALAETNDVMLISEDDTAVVSDAAIASDAIITSDSDTAAEAITTISDLDEGDWAYDSIMALAKRGIITVDENGTVRPSDPANAEDVSKIILAIRKYDASSDIANPPAVTRAEMATVIVKSINASTDNFSALSFSDVTADDENAKYIECAKTLGIVNGYGDGTFRGNQEILRKEAFAMINRLVKLLDALEG